MDHYEPHSDIPYDKEYPGGYKYMYPIPPKDCGEWDPEKTYSVFEYVKYFYSIFRSRKNGNNEVPATYNTAAKSIKFNKQYWKLIIDNTSTYLLERKLGYTENIPDFQKAYVDASDNVLYGVKENGDFYFGGGIPSQVSEKIDELENQMIEADDNLQEQIDSVAVHDSEMSLTISPRVIFRNTSTTININSIVDTGGTIVQNSHIIKRNGTIIKQSSNVNIVTSESINVSSNQTYTSEANINGYIKSENVSITVVDHIYYGAGKNQSSASIAVSTPQTTPAGRYTINVAQNLSYIYFDMPNTMSIKTAKVNGFDMPLSVVTSSRTGYKCYRSNNTYDAGTIVVDIT